MFIITRLYHTFRAAFFWDNPLEILIDYHLLRRSDPIRLRKSGMSVLVNYRHSDMQAAHDVLIDGMYDQALKLAYSSKTVSKFRYLNLGANIGTFDLRAAQFLQNAEIKFSGVAVEMNTATFARLVVNLEINRLLSIRPLNVALAEVDGEVLCQLDARDTGQAVGDSENHPESEHPVAAMSWSSLWDTISNGGPFDLVKVDIEGEEKFFLSGLSETQAKSIRCLVIETHNVALHELCDRRLVELGFSVIEKERDTPQTRISLWSRASLGSSACP